VNLIRRSSPFGELLSLRQAMDRLFEDSFIRPGALEDGTNALPLDVYSTDDAVVVEAALPGIKPADVEISVVGDRLTISAKSTNEHSTDEGGYSYREIRRGSLSRTLTLPGGLNADRATASFQDGLLRLSLPKAEAAKPRQIKINAPPDRVTIEGTARDGSGSS
jgi:HSP20 family protein